MKFDKVWAMLFAKRFDGPSRNLAETTCPYCGLTGGVRYVSVEFLLIMGSARALNYRCGTCRDEWSVVFNHNARRTFRHGRV